MFGENRRPNRCIVKHKHNEIGLNCMRKADIDGILRRNSPGKKIVKEKISGDVEQKAKARKDHMLRLEMEQSKKAKSSVTRKKKSVKKELNLGNEQSEDIVKLLNTCKQRTAAFAIRDQQLKDKAIREKEERDYERLMDLEMEVNRLKDIAAREKMEEAKIKKRIADRKVIEDQIKERQHLRLLQEEARDQENRKMLETIKKYEEEDAEKTRKRKEDVRKSKVEILSRNEEILAEREAKKAFEKKEEETIMAYLAERDEILRKREEEEAEAQIKKIELQKKLLEKQTKVLDKRSEEDEIRARRAAEENERKHRLRELKEAQKRKKDSEMLLQSRKSQEQERLIAKKREKQEKQDEYNNTLKQAAEMAKRERDEAAYKKTKNAELRMMLQQQIEENESKRKIQEREKYKEGKEIKDKMVRILKFHTCAAVLPRSDCFSLFMFLCFRRPRGKSLKTSGLQWYLT